MHGELDDVSDCRVDEGADRHSSEDGRGRLTDYFIFHETLLPLPCFQPTSASRRTGRNSRRRKLLDALETA